MKRNHLAAAVLANQDTEKRLHAKEHLLIQLRLALSLFVDHAKVLRSDEGIRSAVKQVTQTLQEQNPADQAAPLASPCVGAAASAQEFVTLDSSDSSDAEEDAQALLAIAGQGAAGGETDGGDVPMEMKRLLKRMQDCKNLLLTALEKLRLSQIRPAAPPSPSSSSSSSGSSICRVPSSESAVAFSRATSCASSKHSAAASGLGDRPQSVAQRLGSAGGESRAGGGHLASLGGNLHGGGGHERNRMFAAAAVSCDVHHPPASLAPCSSVVCCLQHTLHDAI